MGDHFQVLWLFNKGWRGAVDLATRRTRPRSHQCAEALTPGGPERWRSPSHRTGGLGGSEEGAVVLPGTPGLNAAEKSSEKRRHPRLSPEDRLASPGEQTRGWRSRQAERRAQRSG